MKKTLIIGVLVTLICLAAAGATFAWLFDTAEASNTFTVGKIDIELNEPAWDPDASPKIYPGAEIDKNPTVTVKARSEDCYVYVMIDNLLNAAVPDAVALDVDTVNWIPIKTAGSKTLYRYGGIALFQNTDRELEEVFTTVTVDTEEVTEESIDELDGEAIEVKAYAHQASATTQGDVDAKAIAFFL